MIFSLQMKHILSAAARWLLPARRLGLQFADNGATKCQVVLTVLISCSNGSACVFFLTGRKPYKLQSSSTTVIDKMPSLAMTDMRTGSLCTTCVCALTCATLRLNPLYVLCDKKNPTFYWVSPYTTCRYSGWLRRAGIFRLCPRHFSSIKLYIRN